MVNINLQLSFLIALALVLYSPVAETLDPYIFNKQFLLPSPAFGPDSVSFFQNNPDIGYVSVNDGRILKLYVKNGTFEDFAYTSPERTKQRCDGNNDATLAATCGKVFGLSVDNVNQILYAVDAYRGLFSIQIPQGGLATPIANTAGGLPLKVCNGIDVDPTTGDVYFTDASQTLDYSKFVQSGVVLDSTGRLIKYNPKTKQVTVLLSGLFTPSGPAVSFDGRFVLIPLLGNNNIIKYYIQDPRRETTTEILLTLPGILRKIKRASTLGHFWVPIHQQGTGGQPSITTPTAYKFNSDGRVLIIKDLSLQYPNTFVTVIQETNPLTIFVGSRLTNYITEYAQCKTCL